MFVVKMNLLHIDAKEKEKVMGKNDVTRILMGHFYCVVENKSNIVIVITK